MSNARLKRKLGGKKFVRISHAEGMKIKYDLALADYEKRRQQFWEGVKNAQNEIAKES